MAEAAVGEEEEAAVGEEDAEDRHHRRRHIIHLRHIIRRLSKGRDYSSKRRLRGPESPPDRSLEMLSRVKRKCEGVTRNTGLFIP